MLKHSVFALLIAVLVCGCLPADRDQSDSEDFQGQSQPSEVLGSGSVVNVSYGCAYANEATADSIRLDLPSEEAVQAISDVTGYTGLPQNFEIYSSNIQNAMATIIDGRRIIVYDPALIDRVRSPSRSHWSAVSIFAHEIGHHLAGHLTHSVGDPQLELEADQFSGHVLYRMGASLEEAQSAILEFVAEGGSRTHPSRSLRLDAIAEGWRSAANQFGHEATPPPPPRIDEGGLDLPVDTQNHGSETGCYPQDSLKAIVFSVEGMEYPPSDFMSVILELENGRREHFGLHFREMCNACKSWLPIVLLPGRRIIVDYVRCGSGGFTSITRIRVRQ